MTVEKEIPKKNRGGRPKGGPGGPGRPKGVPNKLTTEVKQAILEAFEKAGGVEYLAKVALDDPRTFCSLLGRIVPSEIKAEFTLTDGLAERVRRAKERAAGRG